MKSIIKELYRHSRNKKIINLFHKSRGNMAQRSVIVSNYNAKIPFFILKTLSKDEHHTIRGAIAENRHIPFDILKELTRDKSYIVRVRSYRNPIYKEYVKYKIFTRIKNWIESNL